jgi:hypothetical protein
MSIALKLRTLLVLAFPAIGGWISFGAAEWLVHHESASYGLRDAGFGFISNAADITFVCGPVMTLCAAVVLALPSTVVYLRGVGSFSRALALNLSAVAVLLCMLGSTNIFIAGVFLVMPLVWILAMVWAITHESNQHLQATSR